MRGGGYGICLRGRFAVRRAARELEGHRSSSNENHDERGKPEEAFALSFIPNDGVGLAREEFIITTYIKVHPLALLDYDKIQDPAVKAEIDLLTSGYPDKPQFFVDKLAQGVGDDRRRLLSEGRHPAAERLQDERIRKSCRRRPSMNPRRRIR